MNFAVFDLETNGLKGSSVVSASSIVFDDRGYIRDIFNRFYFPTETPDMATEKIHGLTVERIHWFRQAESYPLYFLEDINALLSFWKRWHVSGIIVHNLAFDTSFLPKEAVKMWKWWCSMLGLTTWCAIPNPRNAKLYKWPRLNEAKMKTISRLKTPIIVREIDHAVTELLQVSQFVQDVLRAAGAPLPLPELRDIAVRTRVGAPAGSLHDREPLL